MGKFTNKLTGKKVLLIGGTSGVGFAVAEAVLDFGGTAIVSSSQQARVDSAVRRLQAAYPDASSRVTGIACDLADSANLDANLTALLTAAAAFGPGPDPDPVSSSAPPIHHVVYTAGNRVYPIPPVADAGLEALGRLASVRYTAAVMLAKHAPRYMASGPEASITLTTNVSEHKPLKGWALSTGATSLNGLTAGLAVDLAPVRVNLVKLGFVATELLRDAARMGLRSGGAWEEGAEKMGGGDEDAEVDEEAEVERRFRRMAQERAARTLTGAVGSPESVAEAYLYFMKDRNVSGQSVVTDGGYVLT